MKVKARLFLPLTFQTGDVFKLPQETAHYVKNVMRTKKGHDIGIFNGQDGEYAAEIIDIDRKDVSLLVKQKIRQHLPCENITLLFAMIKKTPMEYIIQKGTELGCGIFQPLHTEYTQSKEYNFTRFERIAIEAAEQCHLTATPEIRAPLSLNEVISKYNHIIFCAEKGEALPIAKCCESGKVIDAILIGPEGGFSDNEHALLQSAENCTAVSLGPRILRAETAATAALSAYLFHKDNNL